MSMERPKTEVYKSRIIESYPAWHNNVVKESKAKEKDKVYNKEKE